MTATPDLGPESGLLARLAAHRWSRRGLQWGRWAIALALLVIIGRRLTELGWREIWVARPTGILFYVLLVAQFFVQPGGDFLIYRNLWGAGKNPPLGVILRKRFLNNVMDYTGEVFFFFWAQRHVKLPTSTLVHSIKDSNILSAGAGLAMVWLMVPLLLATGGLHLPERLMGQAWLYVMLGSLPLLLCGVLVLAHRKVTVLSRGQIAATFAIHFFRALLMQVVEFGLWTVSGALPSAVACLQFVALRLVVTRLPLIPNKDLVFVGAGIAAAGITNISVTPVATVLVILAAVDLVLGVFVAGIPWALDHLRKEPAP
ncbi:MAG: hypothetical protein JF627_07070 [Alphaproteobacteria bacterium]|nr:hypothetical protein [Alphaproteobacteria bacterium]